MKELNNKELMAIIGGVSITGTLINAAIKAYDAILTFGQNLGSSIRRAFSSNMCQIDK